MWGGSFKITGEILPLPILFMLQNRVIKNNGPAHANQFLMATVFTLIIFMVYFTCIVSLPYPENDLTTMAFGTLYHATLEHSAVYIVGFILTGIINIYMNPMLSRNSQNLPIVLKISLSLCTTVTIFFIITAVLFMVTHQAGYSFLDYFYSILFACFVSLICKLWLVFKSAL